ncbi:MAG: nucleotidyltransferase family protein [Desulfurella sp.]|jgi:predicted nucleotidyltransferase|uniref:nucleotidyltransferase family protein n=1 Tax=Desulfurella sp. TaxID=1962857 RepID=UPI00175B5AF8|nr:nucleotidyltransferase [Hydrogenobaculum sp.]
MKNTLKDKDSIINTLLLNKAYIQNTFHVKDIALFGSYARGEQTKKSDIDILVEFESNHKTFRNYMGLKFYLESLLGLKVDLVSKTAIKERLKDSIVKEALNV